MGCWRSATALLVLAALTVGSAALADGPDLLPPSGAVAGWSREETPRSFTAKNLWEYIDGAADLFLAYGFARVEAAQFVGDGGAERSITVDIYDMGAPINAFGIYVNEKSDDAKPLAAGVQGYEAGELLALWKGRYYVKLAVMDAGDAEPARALATATAERLTGSSGLPAEFGRLPSEGRIAGSEKYVRKDALGHKALSNVVSADYRLGEATAALHLADLADAIQARQAWQKLRSFEKQAGQKLVSMSKMGEAAFAVRDGSSGEMVVARQGQFVIIAMSEKAGRADLAKLADRAIVGLNSRHAFAGR
jgi:hypothetical protein